MTVGEIEVEESREGERRVNGGEAGIGSVQRENIVHAHKQKCKFRIYLLLVFFMHIRKKRMCVCVCSEKQEAITGAPGPHTDISIQNPLSLNPL